MYLKRLSKEAKELFLCFAYHLAMADGAYTSEEQEMMSAYCNEMQLPSDPGIRIRPLVEVLSDMEEECTPQEKRIIVFEALRLAKSDNDFDKTEQKVMDKVMAALDIPMSFIRDCTFLMMEEAELKRKIDSIIL